MNLSPEDTVRSEEGRTPRSSDRHPSDGAQTRQLAGDPGSDIPYGYCKCGCGEQTRLAQRTNHKHGHIKGEPQHYIIGHHARKPAAADYVEEDHGHTTPCWIWQRANHTAGYGAARHNGESTVAHRVYYERIVGPVPEGMELDHLCRVRRCVNPDHLEPVPHSENMRRAWQAKAAA